MEAVAATAAPPDEAVPARTRTGDRKAFRALYEPHVEGMFDFALRVVRDRDLAADILKKTLARAWRLFRQQGGPGGARARLYGLAYDCVLDELRYQWRCPRPKQPARAGLDFTQIDPDRLPDASQVASDKELVELVWDTAAALNAEHYALLDLHVRHGLSPDELANHLAVESDRLQSRLSLLYESFEDEVTSTLLATRCRDNCDDLDAMLSELDAERTTSEIQMEVRKHAGQCDRCQESKRGFTSPTKILRSFAPMPPSRGLRSSVWKHLDAGPSVRRRRSWRRGSARA